MESVAFSRSELESLTIPQLKKLVEYYEIAVHGRLKADYVDAIDNYYRAPLPEHSQEEPEMSVRIRRIKESSNEC